MSMNKTVPRADDLALIERVENEANLDIGADIQEGGDGCQFSRDLLRLCVLARFGLDAAPAAPAQEWEQCQLCGYGLHDCRCGKPTVSAAPAPDAEPFTPDQVVSLWRHQMPTQEDIAAFKVYHPFTCANRGDGKHRDMGSDTGMLIPTVRGWICPFCDYTQNWAHDFMTQPIESAARSRVEPFFDDNMIEHAYWEMDARIKGYNQWKGMPQSQRDAFKWVVRKLLQDGSAAPAHDAAHDAMPAGAKLRCLRCGSEQTIEFNYRKIDQPSLSSVPIGDGPYLNKADTESAARSRVGADHSQSEQARSDHNAAQLSSAPGCDAADTDALIARLERHIPMMGTVGDKPTFDICQEAAAALRAARERIAELGGFLTECERQLQKWIADYIVQQDIAMRAEAALAAEKARGERMRELLRWMNRKGGLGFDVHSRIDDALADEDKDK